MNQNTAASDDISVVYKFLRCETQPAWIERAVDSIELLLIDHAHCEKKAASSALNLMYRYADKSDVLHSMSRLAREELRHFEQVLKLMEARGIQCRSLSPSRYAQTLRTAIQHGSEPGRLVDQLIMGAIIEARSCERFSCLIPHLPDGVLSKFYQGLLACEARHFETYLALATRYAKAFIESRVEAFLCVENAYIVSDGGDEEPFRFHSVR
jgi:tRNA-(ms[2]io[6]A)-hydroxylase